MIGQILDGRYKIDSLIGRGGMGTVYRAQDLEENSTVAVKTLHMEIASETAPTRFYREFRVLTRLNHPHIVKAYGYGSMENTPYLVLEYLPGVTLADKVSQRPLARAEILKIAYQLADALTHLHIQNITHRDLKPSNIMILSDNGKLETKLMDFGLVHLDQTSVNLTKEGSTLGTIAYMSPEQAQGYAIDFRSDLYSFGAILYEMATGRPPFMHENAATVLLQHITTDPKPPSYHNAQIDTGLESLILRLLAKNPENRPASTKWVRDRLCELSDQEVDLTRPRDFAADEVNDSAMIARIPLIGRESQIQKFKELWEQIAQNKQGQIILLEGVVGVGKSRLLEEAQRQIHMGQNCLISGVAREHTALPYQPLIDVFDPAVKKVPAEFIETLPAELRRILPSLTDHSSDLMLTNAGEAKARLFTASWQLLEKIGSHKPVMIAFEDLQWADEASLQLLEFLAQRINRIPMLLVLTYRPEEMEPGGLLEGIVRNLRRLPNGHRISLNLLTKKEVERFLAVALGRDNVSEWLVDQFYQATGGNPFYIGETVKVLAAEGDLEQWARSNSSLSTVVVSDVVGTALQLPQSVLALAERRLSALQDSERSILTTAAVLGQEFSFDLLEQVTQQSEDELIDFVDKLLAMQLVRELPLRNGEDWYGFSQEALRQALLSNISQRRKRVLHRRTGEALSQIYDTNEPKMWPILAYHFAEAGLLERAIKYFILAGDAAVQVYAYREAIAHYSAVLELVNQSNISDFQLLHVYLERGRAYELCLQYHLAIDNYEDMTRVAEKRGNPHIRLRALLAQAIIQITPTLVMDIKAGVSLAREALDLARELDSPTYEATALWNLMLAHSRENMPLEAIKLGEQAIKLAKQENAKEQLAYVYNDIASDYLSVGQPDKSLEIQREAQRLWREIGNKHMLTDNLANTAFSAYLQGDFEQALAAAQESRQISEQIDNMWGMVYSAWSIGYVYIDQGEVGKAIELMDGILHANIDTAFRAASVYIPANYGWSLGLFGGVEQARVYIKEAYRRANDYFEPMIEYSQIMEADILLIHGHVDEAMAKLEGVVGLEATEDVNWRAGFLSYVVGIRQSLGLGEWETAVKRADHFLEFLRKSNVVTYLAQALHLKGLALLQLSQCQDARDILLEAHKMADAIGSRRLAWQILYTLAHVMEKKGDSEQAQTYYAQGDEVVAYIRNTIPENLPLRADFERYSAQVRANSPLKMLA